MFFQEVSVFGEIGCFQKCVVPVKLSNCFRSQGLELIMGDFDCVDVRGLVSPVFLRWFLTMGSL